MFAERLRRSVEGLSTAVDDIKATVTISVGEACWTADRPKVTKETLIETADRALYMSKNDGRNRVTVLEFDNQ